MSPKKKGLPRRSHGLPKRKKKIATDVSSFSRSSFLDVLFCQSWQFFKIRFFPMKNTFCPEKACMQLWATKKENPLCKKVENKLFLFVIIVFEKPSLMCSPPQPPAPPNPSSLSSGNF